MKKGKIVVKRIGMEDLTYIEVYYFIVGPKAPKHAFCNANAYNAIVGFEA